LERRSCPVAAVVEQMDTLAVVVEHKASVPVQSQSEGCRTKSSVGAKGQQK
jgi:hypothetical protein